MDAVAIVVAAVIPILAVGVVAWVLLKRLRAREYARRIVRDKLDSTVTGHREMADAHASSVQERAAETEAERERI